MKTGVDNSKTVIGGQGVLEEVETFKIYIDQGRSHC